MTLQLLVFIVVTGILLVVAAVHFTGGGETARIESEQRAVSRFNADFPEDKIINVWRAEDGATAILAFNGGAGIIRVIGDKLITRRIPDHSVAVSRKGRELALSLNERIWRGCVVHLTNEAEAAECEAALLKYQAKERAV